MNDFGRLLEREIPRLRRYARALTRDVSRADDLVQDTLVRAIAKQDRWQWDSSLRAWLFTLMHNQNVNGVRRSMREGIAVEFDDKWPSPTAATDPSGEAVVARSRSCSGSHFRGATPGDSANWSGGDIV